MCIRDRMRGGQFSVGGTDSHGFRPVLLPQELAFLEYPGARDPKFKGGGMSRTGSMILPSRSKSFYFGTSVNPREREPFWNLLWNQASNALRLADEIVVIGYSLPEADERARDMLLSCYRPTACVTVCCKGDNERLGREFHDAGYKVVRTDTEEFDGWLDECSGTSFAEVGALATN